MSDEPIGIGVIGAGHWGPNLIRNLDNRQTSYVKSVADRDSGRLAQMASRFPDICLESDAEALILDGDIEAVVIATPTITHFGLASRALRAGKHVLVEKPIAATRNEAESLCQLASETKLVVMVGHTFIYNAAVQRVRELLLEDLLGKVYYISMSRTNLGPIRFDVHAAWDLAPHDISIANFWLQGQPVTVSARAGNWINPGVYDAVFATLTYPGDVIVNLHCSWLHPRKNRDISIIGDHRMLTFDDMSMTEPVRIYDKGVAGFRVNDDVSDTFASFRGSVREGDITIPSIKVNEPLKAECDHFIECVRYDKIPLSTAEDGAQVVAVLEAIDESIQQGGRTVNV